MTKKSELREKVIELETQIVNLLNTNETLELWRKSWLATFDDHQGSLQSIHNAWTQLLILLKVEHQTAAVLRIEKLIALEQASAPRLELTQKLAAAESNVRLCHLAIKQLEFQRDSAESRENQTSFDLGNTKARVEELENLMREVDTEMENFSEYASPKMAQLKTAMARMVGDEV